MACLLSTANSFSQGFQMSSSNWSIPNGGEVTSTTNHRFRYTAHQAFTSDANGSQSYAVMDMNGDAIPDLVVYNEVQGGVLTVFSPASNPYWQVFLGTSSGFSSSSINWSIPTGGEATSTTNHRFRYLSHQAFTSDANGSQSYALMDMNGDNKPDLVIYNEVQGGVLTVFSPSSNPYWMVYLNTGTGFSSTAINWSIPTGGEVTSTTNHRFRYLAHQAFTSDANGSQSYALMDMDGDNKPDLVIYNEVQGGVLKVFSPASNPYWSVFLNTGNGFASSSINWAIPNGGEVTSTTNHRFRYISHQAFTSDANGSQSYEIMDMNADGKPDLLVYNEVQGGVLTVFSPASNPYWSVFLNTGSGFSMSSINWAIPNGGEATSTTNHRFRYTAHQAFTSDANGSQSYMVTDIDGDSKVDLLVYNEVQGGVLTVFSPASNPYWQVFLGTGSGFSMSSINWAIPNGGEVTSTTNHRFRYTAHQAFTSDANGSQSYSIMDMNGDGKVDLLVYNEVQGSVLKVFSPASNPYWMVYLNTSSVGFQTYAKENNEIIVYPNPFVTDLYVKMKNTDTDYSITDAMGKVVLSGKLNQEQNTINVEKLPSGFYLLQTNNKTNSIKLIKE